MTKRIVIRALIVLIMSYLLSSANMAFAFVCKGGQINIGDPMVKVLDKCGEPHFKNIIASHSYGRGAGSPGESWDTSKTEDVIEQWTYKDIPYHHGRYVVMTFQGGLLLRIKEKAK